MTIPVNQVDAEQYRILIKSNPEFIDLTKEDQNLFIKVSILDSIFDFFPYAEFYYRDNLGIIAEMGFFIEGLEFNLKFGNEEDGYLEHDYCWSENHFADPEMGDHIAGTNAFIFLSKHYKEDDKKSRAWNDTKENIVKEVIKKDWGITDFSFISKTKGKDYEYQLNENSAEFLERITETAVSINKPKSPIFSFINSAGEFYFMSLEEMFLQTPVETLELSWQDDRLVDDNKIQDYAIVQTGMPNNKENYKKKIYWYDETGTFNEEELDIKDYLIKHGGKGKFLLNIVDQKVEDYVDFKIYEESDKNNIKGFKNDSFVDSLISYRMDVTVPFNINFVSGKTVELKIDSSDEERGGNKEYSGIWLITETQILSTSAIAGIPKILLRLAKSTIDIDRAHKFVDDFIE